MNDQTNTFVLSLVEQAVQHVVLRVIESIGPAMQQYARTAVEEALDANENLSIIGSTVIALRADIDNINANPLETLKGNTGFKDLVKQYVTDYLDDNRTLSRMDESLDSLTTRVDDLEAEDGSGMSRKMKDNIENVVQDKLDSSEFVQKDDLSSKIGEVINEGSFTINFNRY